MASFTDQPLRFSQHISDIPIDTYAAVGLRKQQEYEQGVSKVQAYLDSVSGLNVVRPQDKQYIQQRLNDMTSKVNSIASSDWSNQAIVKQVGAMAGSIYNDGVVQSAIAGSKKYMKDEQSIEEAKKSGKWAPENEWILRRQMQRWLQDASPGASYNSGGYKPYENVTEDIMKAWKDVKPNSRLIQKPNGDFYAYEIVDGQKVGADGRTLIETQIKELRPDEIRDQINALLTGSQKEQLAITGSYNGRNLDLTNLHKSIDAHYKQNEEYFDSLLAEANQQKAINGGNSDKLSQIDEQIAQINKKKEETAASKSALKSDALTNPDGVKSSMYYERWLNGISKTLGYTDTSTKIVENPAYKAQLDEARLWLDLEKAKMSDDRMRDIAAMRGSGKAKTTVNEDGSVSVEWDPATLNVLPQTEEQRQGIDVQNFRDKVIALNNVNQEQTNELLYRFFGDRYVNRATVDLNKDGIIETSYALKPGMKDEANAVIAQWKDKYKRGDADLDPKIKISLAAQDESSLVANKLGTAISNVEQQGDNMIKNDPRYPVYRTSKQAFDNLQPAIYQGIQIRPSDIEKYHKLASKVRSGVSNMGAPGATGTIATKEELAQVGLTEQQYYVMREAINRPVGSFDPNLSYIREMHNANQNLVAAYQPLMDRKNEYMNTQLRRYQGIFNQVASNVPSGKAEQVSVIANFVQGLAGIAKETNLSGSTDWGSVRSMIGEKHRKETTYAYVQDRDGNVRIRVTNADVDKGKPQEIVVDPETARVNNFYTPDYLGTARSLLDLGEGIRTGSSLEESVPLQNGRTGRYNVRYEVENYKGQYQLKLYVSDTQDKSINGKPVPISRGLFPDWNSLSQFLSTDVNETFVRGLLGGGTTQTNTFSSQFQGNPFIQQMQQQTQ